MTEYFLISKEELDTIVSRHITTKIEMVIRSRPAPSAIRKPVQYLPISLNFQPICIDKPCIGQIDICPVDDECDSVKQCVDHAQFLRANPDVAEHNRKIITQHDAIIRKDEHNQTLDETRAKIKWVRTSPTFEIMMERLLEWSTEVKESLRSPEAQQ